MNKKWAFRALMISLFGVLAYAPCAGATASPAQAHKAVAPATIVDFVRAVLPYAATDFRALRGARIKTDLPDNVYAAYLLASPVCPSCRIYDNYAQGNTPEHWSVGNIYWPDPAGSGELIEPSFDSTPSPTPAPSPLPGSAAAASPPPSASPENPFNTFSPPPEWPVKKSDAYVIARLGPLLKDFSLRRTTSPGLTGGQVQTLRWSGPHDVWVDMELYPHLAGGIVNARLFIGHDHAKSEHVILPATSAQIAEMQSSVRQMARAAIAAAPGDFSQMRGAETVSDSLGHINEVTSSFGRGFRYCELVDVKARGGGPETSAVQCITPPVLGNRTKLEKFVHASINAALPRGFIEEDPRFRYDALWRNANGVEVAILWGWQGESIVTFTVRVNHLAKK